MATAKAAGAAMVGAVAREEGAAKAGPAGAAGEAGAAGVGVTEKGEAVNTVEAADLEEVVAPVEVVA